MISPYYIYHLLILFCIYGILAFSYNLSLGFTGLPLLGIVGFFAIGAYTSALLAMAGVPYVIGLLCSGLIAAIIGLLLGVPALRIRGGYFSIVTLGFAEILRLVFNNELWLTNGPYGIKGIPRPELFSFQFDSYEKMLLLVITFLLVTYFFFQKVVRSPFGRVIRAIREDETAASMLGKYTWWFKMQVFAITAFFSGIAGNLWAHFTTYIDPMQFQTGVTIFVLAALVIGGLGNNKGVLIGVLIMQSIPELLRFIGFPPLLTGAIRQLIMGAALVFIMIRRPGGIFRRKRQ